MRPTFQMSLSSHINFSFKANTVTPDNMPDQQAQAVYDKLDKAQYFLDRAVDIINELKDDRDFCAVERAHPWTKLQQRIEIVEGKINIISDKTMATMMKNLKQAGAQENGAAATENARPNENEATNNTATPNRLPRLAENYINRTPAPSNTPASKGNSIPTLKEDLSKADKMMVQWKADGKSWAEIKVEYERLNGGKPMGNSTLPNRYVRLKASLGELGQL